VWVFGFLFLLVTLVSHLGQFVRGNLLLILIYLPISLAVSILYLIGVGGLIFCIDQASLKKSPNFSKIWQQGKSRVFRLIGLSFLLIPALLVAVFAYMVISFVAPTSPLVWLVVLTSQTFIG
jgi:hypothetical protein